MPMLQDRARWGEGGLGAEVLRMVSHTPLDALACALPHDLGPSSHQCQAPKDKEPRCVLPIRYSLSSHLSL
jgi:hypothetical protein